jgi:hypothetical protein
VVQRAAAEEAAGEAKVYYDNFRPSAALGAEAMTDGRSCPGADTFATS